MILTRPDDFNPGDVFVDLSALTNRPFYLKIEGLNLAGTIKLKAARSMVDAAERRGALHPGVTLVESSSGGLGVALSMIAASRGYRFICVTDIRCSLTNRQLMEALGATVEVVTVPHPERGLLGTRLARLAELAARPNHLWLNQYENPANAGAHFAWTGPQILAEFPNVETLFIGVGTSGTAMGTARYIRRHRPGATIVGIDAVGSVTFGGPAGPRHIPGLGSGVRHAQFKRELLDDTMNIEEVAAVHTCRVLAGRGFLFGGSTGTVVAGALEWLAAHDGTGPAVAIAPDLGERYLDTIYSDAWAHGVFGPAALDPLALPA